MKTLCLNAYHQTLINGETTLASLKEKGMLEDHLENLQCKPNFKLTRALDHEFHEQEGKTPWIVMCERNEFELANALAPYLTPEDLELAAEDGNTALHIACRSSSNEIIDLLMTHRPSLSTTKNNSGLIPILCADSARRLAIIQNDKSGHLYKSLLLEIEDNIAKIVETETQLYLSTNNSFFGGFSSYTKQARELSQNIKANRSSHYRAPSSIAITLFCKRLENPGTLEHGYLDFHLLQTINNNITLKTALDLPDANFANQESSTDYCQLVIQKLNRLVHPDKEPSSVTSLAQTQQQRFFPGAEEPSQKTDDSDDADEKAAAACTTGFNDDTPLTEREEVEPGCAKEECVLM